MPFSWTDVYHIYINYQTNKETEGSKTVKLNFNNGTLENSERL